jgi:rod shape determining protein RodA
MAMLMFQVFQNVGMALGIMPVTGIPLPLMSYGGSSIITVFVGLGLVLSVHLRRYA